MKQNQRSDLTKIHGLRRLSGILMHPTSLPGPFGIGDVGPAAREFVDFLETSGQHLWQTLPLGPVDETNSPYNSPSSFAGNPLLISPELLIRDGLLTEEDLYPIPDFPVERVDYPRVKQYKYGLYQKAFRRFLSLETLEDCEEAVKEKRRDYQKFCDGAPWLSSYAAFMAEGDFDGRSQWVASFDEAVTFEQFLQWQFFAQWKELKAYANEHGILLIGDIPIFVSAGSVDVKDQPELFLLDEDGHPTVVSGVPPDYFSETGQLWGNPIYDWAYHKKTGYAWWLARIKAQLTLSDLIRIDHFRGFESYWEIPAEAETALEGRWVKGPGHDFFDKVVEMCGPSLPIIAEDLGIITDEVRELRDAYELPGMKVLQFAFEDEDSSYLPYNQPYHCVCYSGTHDNDTSTGWYDHADEKAKDKVRRYMNTDAGQISWDFVRTCFGSPARYAIVPVQDLFCQGSEYRMNIPGVPEGNWGYRMAPGLCNEWVAKRLYDITKLYGR